MKTRPVNKKVMVSKKCPECDLSIAVACRSCQCGYQFKKGNSPTRTTRNPGPPSKVVDNPEQTRRRRTERVRRTRPHFYNSLEFVQTSVRRRRNTSTSVSSGGEETKKKRGRPRQHKVKEEETTEKEKEKVKEDDAYAQVPAEKALQYAVILAEINCKMMTQNFKPF